MMSLPIWLPGPMFFLEGLSPWSHVRSSRGLCLGGLCLGGLCPGGLCPQGGLCRETPNPESKKQAIRILLECILVHFNVRKIEGFFWRGRN